jgi:Holliday junction resolvase
VIEKKLQAEIIRWLRATGCYVVKTRPGAGTPVGAPDVLFFLGSKFGMIEVKVSPKSKFQPGQKMTLDRLRQGNEYIYVVCPENWESVKAYLMAHFFQD